MTKYYLLQIYLIPLVALFFYSLNFSHDPIEMEKKFGVSISQNGETIDIKNNTVTLNDTTFDIVINFSEPMGILVSASFDKSTYEKAKKNKPLNKLDGFTELGMADGLSNPDKEVLISDKAPNYWYFDSASESRFNKTEVHDNGISCTRTIEKVYDVSTGSTISVQDVKKDLFLVFISYKQGENLTDRIEIQRQCIKLVWKKVKH